MKLKIVACVCVLLLSSSCTVTNKRLTDDRPFGPVIERLLYVGFTEDGMIEGGLRIGYTTYDRVWEVAAFGRNITDSLYRTGGIDFNNLTGWVNEPRTFGMEIRRSF